MNISLDLYNFPSYYYSHFPLHPPILRHLFKTFLKQETSLAQLNTRGPRFSHDRYARTRIPIASLFFLRLKCQLPKPSTKSPLRPERVLAHAVVSAPSATAAIQALSVLPYAVTPSALPLVLARGDTTLLPHRAISSGNAWLLPLYPPAIIHQDLEATLSSASALGDLETVQWAWKHANRSEVRVRSPGIHAAVVDAALRCGQVPVLNWYLNTKSSSDDQVLVPERLLSDAISREHVHVMEFLVVTKALIPPMLPMTALKASAQGSVLVLDWMWSLVARGAAKLEMNDRILTQLLGEASREGHVRVLQWWRDHAWFQDDFTASMGTIGDQAARGGSLAVFDWWWDVLTQDHLSSNSSHQGYSIGTDRVLRIATAGGHDDIVAWYKSKASKLRVFSYTADGWSPQPLTWPIVC